MSARPLPCFTGACVVAVCFTDYAFVRNGGHLWLTIRGRPYMSYLVLVSYLVLHSAFYGWCLI